MKILVVLILGLTGFSGGLRAEVCPDSNYTLTTDAELELFRQIGCTRINGALVVGTEVPGFSPAPPIAGSGITSLSGLGNLKEVHRLTISNNAVLSSLSGLSSDFVVTGALEISQNDSLATLDGLGCIDSSNPNVVRIYDNPALSSCDAVAPAFGEFVSSCASLVSTASASGGDDSTCGYTTTAPGSVVYSYSCGTEPSDSGTNSGTDSASSDGEATDDGGSTSGTPRGTSDGTNVTDFGVSNLVENNAPGCNSVDEILQSVAPPAPTSTEASTEAPEPTLQLILESPAENETYSGVSTLRGWAVAEEEISKVDIFIDGNFFQSAPYGGSRGDVGSIFPEINDSDKSGFALAFNFNNLSEGTHTIRVEAVTNLLDPVCFGCTRGTRSLSRTAQFRVTKFPASFLPSDRSPDLSEASCVINDQRVHILDTLVDGSVYDVSLQWRTADQGFQIQEIR